MQEYKQFCCRNWDYVCMEVFNTQSPPVMGSHKLEYKTHACNIMSGQEYFAIFPTSNFKLLVFNTQSQPVMGSHKLEYKTHACNIMSGQEYFAIFPTSNFKLFIPCFQFSMIS